jgi:acetyltransferase-like isoleucine patch superfamily enzyme
MTREPDNEYKARGSVGGRLMSVLFLLPAWFAPHKVLRSFFHRLRGVNVGRGVEIGYFCVIGNVHPGMITIGDGAVITAGAMLLEHDNSRYYTYGGDVEWGPVRIGRRAFVGVYAVVMPGVAVGDGAIVGAHSLVRRDVEAHTIVAGVPAKVVGETPARNADS